MSIKLVLFLLFGDYLNNKKSSPRHIDHELYFLTPKGTLDKVVLEIGLCG